MPQERTEKPPFALLVFGRYAIWGLYALLGVSLLLLAWWFVEEFGGRTSGIGGARAVVVGNRGEAASPAASLADVERWAQLGDYREAIHALLLVAIQRLIEPLPARPGPSRTSRELQRLLPLGPGRREAFAALVRQVEVSIFGDHAVDSRRYAECREAFDALFAGHET